MNPHPFSFRLPEGKTCAVSLTYDDAFDAHWQEVAPELERRGFRGTFYTPIRASLWNNAAEWRKVAEAGHELGNHTVFHPCRRKPDAPDYEAFTRNDLSRFTLEEFQRELEVANAYLQLLDGRSERTYGNTCHNTTVGRGEAETSITPVLEKLFPAARGPRKEAFEASDPATLNIHEIGCISSHQSSLLKQGIDHALESGGWLVICLHTVGPEEARLCMARKEHDAMLDYLVAHPEIWVAPVVEVAERPPRRD